MKFIIQTQNRKAELDTDKAKAKAKMGAFRALNSAAQTLGSAAKMLAPDKEELEKYEAERKEKIKATIGALGSHIDRLRHEL